jgi:hypothetical protein
MMQQAAVIAVGLLLCSGCSGRNRAVAVDGSPSSPFAAAPNGARADGTDASPDAAGGAAPSQPAETPPGPSSVASQGEDTPRTVYLAAVGAVDGMLERNCGRCHGKAVPTAPCGLKFDNVEDLVATRILTPLSVDESRVLSVILDGSMPPPGVEPRPDTADIEQLRTFIDDPLFWGMLPAEGHSEGQALQDAQNNACDAASEPTADAGAADAG